MDSLFPSYAIHLEVIKTMVNYSGKSLYNCAIDHVGCGNVLPVFVSLGTLFLDVEEFFTHIGIQCQYDRDYLRRCIQGRLEICEVGQNVKVLEALYIIPNIIMNECIPDPNISITIIFYNLIYKEYVNVEWKNLCNVDKELVCKLCSTFLRSAYTSGDRIYKKYGYTWEGYCRWRIQNLK